MGSYDYIVVGGGSAGCIVAAELSSDCDRRVLLLEAGPSAEAHPETLRADGYKDAFLNDELMWERFSVPQAQSANQRVFLGTGTVLGGSGSVNGMVYTRGAREDYDEWPVGWRWDDVAPDYEAIEERLRPHRREATRWSEACIESAEARGFRRKENLNDGDLSNVIGYEWMSYDGDERRSSYVAFLRDAIDRENLTVLSNARAHRIVFNADKRATGVEFEHDGELVTAMARRAVTLCAGALETPKLLILSGVGPADELRRHEIPMVAEREMVGRNLHDHPNVPVFFRGDHKVDCYYPQLYSFFRTNEGSSLPPSQSDTCYVYWPAPSAMKEVTQRMLPSKVLPHRWYGPRSKEWVRSAVRTAFKLGGVRKFVDHLFGVILILGKPKSRGTLSLCSANVRDDARIDPAYYDDPEDLQTMVKGVRLAREIAGSGGLHDWNAKELLPGKRIQADEALAKWVRKNTITTYHFAGTCSMGPLETHVVDPQLRVRGVTGLRVADASAIPTTPVSALNAPSMLIGYRAARLIKRDG